jgi:imidazolonepropionase-like amidohydrolase
MTDALLAIRAGRLVDSLAGEVVVDRTLVVRDGRVEAILPPGAATPEDARSIDLSGHTVIPGLIDCHSHLVGGLEYHGIPGADTSEAQEAMLGVRNARDTVAVGFTTVRDVGTFRAFVDTALRDAIDAGWTPGPRMQCAGAYITCPGGGGSVAGLARDVTLPPDLGFGIVTTPDQVRNRVRALVGGGADVIKLIVTGAVLTRGTKPGLIELDEPIVRAAVEEADRMGIFVAAHAHGAQGIRMAAGAGVRSIEHGSLLDDEGIELLARLGTYLVADVYNGDWIAVEGARAGWPAETMDKNEETTEAQRIAFRKAVAAGVRIAFGTDSGVYPHGRNAIQLRYMVRYGMTPLAAIRSATVVAAELMGWQDRVGSLAPGRYADLLAVPGDPLDAPDGSGLDALMAPAFVMKGGAVVVDQRG